MDNSVFKVKVCEIGPQGEGYEPTGRSILLDSDCPLFDSWGAVGAKAREERAVAVEAELFASILAVVKECEGS